MTNRDDVIDKMVAQYRAQLEEQEDEELLGDTLTALREHTIERMTERYEVELDEEMKFKIEHFQDELEEQSNEDLLGCTLPINCYTTISSQPSSSAKATTLLYPGYVGTPEYGLILRNGMPGMTRHQVVEVASRMTRRELETKQDYSLIKMFHDNGIPQIIETDEDYYAFT